MGMIERVTLDLTENQKKSPDEDIEVDEEQEVKQDTKLY